MKTRMTTIMLAAALVVASAAFAQQTQSSSTDRRAPQAQQVPGQPDIPTRTSAPRSGQGDMPSTTTYSNPPAPPVAVEAPAVEVPVAEAPAPVPPPAPVVAETTTTTYEELPGSASSFPSIGLAGLALMTVGLVIRRKNR